MQNNAPSQSGIQIEKWLYSRILTQQANINSKVDTITHCRELMLQILVNQIMYSQPKNIYSSSGSQTKTKMKKIQLQLNKSTANQLVRENLDYNMEKLVENEIIDRIYQKYMVIRVVKDKIFE